MGVTNSGDWTGRVAGAITVACVALVALTVGVLAMPAARARLGLAPARTASYAVGTTIDVPAAVYESSPFTLILFARNTCAACQRSVPLFAKLTADLATYPAIRSVMMTTAETRPGDVDYAKRVGLTADQLITLAPSRLRLQLVPTVVLVNQQGQVFFSHEGVPSAADMEVLLHTATSLTEKH